MTRRYVMLFMLVAVCAIASACTKNQKDNYTYNVYGLTSRILCA